MGALRKETERRIVILAFKKLQKFCNMQVDAALR